MGSTMNDDRPTSSSDIAEGLPPLPPIPEEPPDRDIRAKPESSARDLFLAWEKLRLVGNAVLLLWLTYVFYATGRITVVDALRHILSVNVGFCVFPVAENYLCWFGLSRSTSRFIVITAILFVTLVGFLDFMQS
jgi:hypothetical protein